jgi:hypothetical protein
MTEPDYLTAPPPWKAFPEIQPDELVAHLRQGAAEPWFDQEWRPFWASLDEGQRERYLQHWSASPAWRDAMMVFDVDPDLDLEADARESEEYLRHLQEQQGHGAKPWWRRLLQRKP